MHYSLPGSSIHGIFPARVLEWISVYFSSGSSWCRDWTRVSHIAGRRFTIWATWEALSEWLGEVKWSEVAQSCPTLCNPVNCSLPGSSVHRIFQARVLEWVVLSFSRGSSQPRDQTWVPHIAGRRFTIWATREAKSDWIVVCNFTLYVGISWMSQLHLVFETMNFKYQLCKTNCSRHKRKKSF